MSEKKCPFNPNYKKEKICNSDCALYVGNTGMNNNINMCAFKGLLYEMEDIDRHIIGLQEYTLGIAKALSNNPVSNLNDERNQEDG